MWSKRLFFPTNDAAGISGRFLLLVAVGKKKKSDFSVTPYKCLFLNQIIVVFS